MNPKIVDFDHQSVTMQWQTPNDDGGRPISHYIIQKKDTFGGWFDALVTSDTNCSAKIDQLETRGGIHQCEAVISALFQPPCQQVAYEVNYLPADFLAIAT
jgi:hypothetical protein